jgi:hypothetical protein
LVAESEAAPVSPVVLFHWLLGPALPGHSYLLPGTACPARPAGSQRLLPGWMRERLPLPRGGVLQLAMKYLHTKMASGIALLIVCSHNVGYVKQNFRKLCVDQM